MRVYELVLSAPVSVKTDSLGRRRKYLDRDLHTGGIVTVVFKEIPNHCRYFLLKRLQGVRLGHKPRQVSTLRHPHPGLWVKCRANNNNPWRLRCHSYLSTVRRIPYVLVFRKQYVYPPVSSTRDKLSVFLKS
jgi:hypothetical protein